MKEVVHRGATEAVGALSGLRGEITIVGGRTLISYGKPCAACGNPLDEHATLLVSGKVTDWLEPQPLPNDLNGGDLDRFIVERATAAGIDTNEAFPVRLKGDLVDVKMHVIAAPNDKFTGHGSAHPMAAQQDISEALIAGEVVGYYAPPQAQGIITHPGEPFHYHWVDLERTRTAHLDAFGMARGSLLFLPKR